MDCPYSGVSLAVVHGEKTVGKVSICKFVLFI